MNNATGLAILGGLWLLAKSRDSSATPTPSTPAPAGPLDEPLQPAQMNELQQLVAAEHARSIELQREAQRVAPVEPAPVPAPAPGAPVEPSPAQLATPPAAPLERSTVTGGRWTLAPAIAATGDAVARSGEVPNRQGTQLPSDDLTRAQLPAAPGLAELVRYLRDRTHLTIGTARGRSVQAPARRADGSLRRRDVHEEGRAGDVMTSDRAIGTAVADWLVAHAGALGIQQVIWSRTYWSSAPLSRRSPHSYGAYSGRSPHTDHVHFELSPTWAFDVARVRAALAQIDPLTLPAAR